MARHKAAPRHAATRSAFVIAVTGLLLALGAGGAVATVGTTQPGPRDCVTLIQALVSAQVLVDDREAELRAAVKVDVEALDVRQKVIVNSQKLYNDVDRPAAEKVKDDPKTETDERADALKAALAKRDAAITAADKDYTSKGTVAAVQRATSARDDALRVLAEVKIDVSKACTKPAPKPEEDQPVDEAPKPGTVEADLPVTH